MQEEIIIPILWDHVQQANRYATELGQKRSLSIHSPVAFALRAHFPKAHYIFAGLVHAEIDEKIFCIDPRTREETVYWMMEGHFHPCTMVLKPE